MRQVNIIVEEHADGFIAYPVGVRGVVVGQGDSCAAALADVKSALRFHMESFGPAVLEVDPPVLEVYVAEAAVEI